MRNSFNIQGRKNKKINIFKRSVTVRSTWMGKEESSAVNNVYNIPGACETSRSKIQGGKGFVTSFTSRRSQVQLSWQRCCVRVKEVSLLLLQKG